MSPPNGAVSADEFFGDTSNAPAAKTSGAVSAEDFFGETQKPKTLPFYERLPLELGGFASHYIGAIPGLNAPLEMGEKLAFGKEAPFHAATPGPYGATESQVRALEQHTKLPSLLDIPSVAYHGIADPLGKLMSATFTEEGHPKTAREAWEVGASGADVALAGTAAIQGVKTTGKVLTGIKEASEAKRIAGIQAQADEVRAKAQDEHRARRKAIQQRYDERKRAIGDEYNKRVRELQTGSEALPLPTGEPRPSVPSAKDVEARVEEERWAHKKEINAEYERRREAIRSEIHRAHVEAEEAMHAELREAQLDADNSLREAAKAEKDALKGVRGEAAARIRKARADYRAHQKKVAATAEASSDLPESDVSKDSPKGTLGRDMRAAFLRGYREAVMEKREGGEEFKRYLARGKQLEDAGNPFIASESGRSFMGYLRNIETPPPDAKVTQFSVEFRNAAQRLEKNMRGQVPRGTGEYGQLLEQPRSSVPAPLSIEAIDEEIRNLRALENRTDLAGSDAIQRGRAKTLADHLEAAVKNWVGEDYWARDYYAQMSENYNKFSRPLFKDAVGRVELDYQKPRQSPFTVTAKDFEGKVFGSAESVREAKAFLGDDELNQYASRHVSNELYGKDAKAAMRWWEDARKNGWIKETPEANNMTRRYVESLAQQEGDLETLGALDKARKAAVAEARDTVEKAIGKAAKDRAKAEAAAKTALQTRVQKAQTAREATRTQLNEKVTQYHKETTAARQQSLEEMGAALENRVKEARATEKAARQQLEKSQKEASRQAREAATARGETANAAKRKAAAQFKDALKEAEKATKESEALVAEANKTAKAMFDLLAGERPATVVAKFENTLEPLLRQQGISDAEIQRFKAGAMALDREASRAARNAKIKKWLWGVAAVMVGSGAVGTVKKLIPE